MSPQENRITCSHVCHNKQGSAGCEPGAEDQRERGLTVAYQQASAVPKPPAAILSSQHEREGLAVEKKKHIHMRINTKTHKHVDNLHIHTFVLGLAQFYI